MAVDVDGTGDGFAAGKPRSLFTGPFLGGLGGVTVPGLSFPDYDVALDGKRFVMFKGSGNEVGVTTMNVITGWYSEVQRLTGSNSQ